MNAKLPGRPRLPSEIAKRHPLNMKCTAKLRAQLITAAEISGRNISAEVEYRLEASFLPNDVLIGTEQTQALLQAIGGAIQVAEQATGADWHEAPRQQAWFTKSLSHSYQMVTVTHQLIMSLSHAPLSLKR